MAKVLLSTAARLPFHTLRNLFPAVPPLGVQILGSVLEKSGHKVKIADVQHLKPLHKQFILTIETFQPDVISFTNNAMANAQSILNIATEVKKRFPHIHIIAGGQFPTFSPQFFLSGKDIIFDAVGLFQGEKVIAPLVDAVTNNLSLSDIPGIAYRGNNDTIIRTQSLPMFESADDFPIPKWEKALKKASICDGFAASIETLRGCPYECAFCSIPNYFGKQPKYKSVDRIIKELHILKKLGVREIFIIDDSFATNLKTARELFKRMIEEDFQMRFSAQIRADIVARHPDLIRLGAKAGLYLVVVGFEGYSAAVMTETEKKNTVSNNRKASKILRQNNVAIFGTHIIGGPHTGLLDYFKTFFLGRHYSDIFRVTIYTPLFGSKKYHELLKENKILSLDPQDYNYGSYVVKDEHNPIHIKLIYFTLQLLHYLLPGTIIKTFASPNPITRIFNRRAYKGAFEFVIGTIVETLKINLNKGTDKNQCPQKAPDIPS